MHSPSSTTMPPPLRRRRRRFDPLPNMDGWTVLGHVFLFWVTHVCAGAIVAAISVYGFGEVDPKFTPAVQFQLTLGLFAVFGVGPALCCMLGISIRHVVQADAPPPRVWRTSLGAAITALPWLIPWPSVVFPSVALALGGVVTGLLSRPLRSPQKR